jgi:hypothetical protein
MGKEEIARIVLLRGGLALARKEDGDPGRRRRWLEEPYP